MFLSDHSLKFKALTEDDISTFETSLQASGLSSSSINRCISALKSFYKYAALEHDVINPMQSIERRKLAQKLPKALTISEITAMIDSAKRVGDIISLRDHAILELLYGTGARVSEVVGINLNDVSVPEDMLNASVTVKLRGKGSKERIVPIGSFAFSALQEYLVRTRPSLVEKRAGSSVETALFLNNRGTRLSRVSAWQIVSDAADAAEKKVAILFLISALGAVLLIYSYIFVREDVWFFIPVMGDTNAKQFGIGMGMAISLFFIGMGAIQWARTLMPDNEVVAQRHEFRSEDADREDFVATVKERAGVAGLGRRPFIKRSLGLALGLAGLSPLVLLRDLGPLPKNELSKTSWKAGTRLVTDPGDRPIRPSDLEVGSVAQILPELAPGQKRTLEDIGKDAVLLIRVRPAEFNLDAERLSWTHEGIIAFSKICSHMGCAVALYEQQTKHLLCPCHQSTFDVTRAAKVIFGPAARPLPQLAITVDSEGYLVAQQGFTEPVGPSFWERSS
ncbi:unannotated protein [freshwater metagenome]|uniref:Rieske iron-sulfur protein n=1 Tax=freshwater metagenome TaxID=449393 RepID=A0A6J6FBL9_9ZZZZ